MSSDIDDFREKLKVQRYEMMVQDHAIETTADMQLSAKVIREGIVSTYEGVRECLQD